MITLSFSTINNCLQPYNSHNWLNKMLGAKPEDKWYYHAGTEAHRIIQQHVSGAKKHPYLQYIKEKFPVVERVDFDPRCKFAFIINSDGQTFPAVRMMGHILPKNKKNYVIIGYFDGRDEEWTKGLEIKTSSNPWSVGKFQKSMQRKLYSLAKPSLKFMYLITGQKDPAQWENEPPKMYKVPVTDQDRRDATEWILKAIHILEAGEFKGGLDENGKCTDPNCYYGANCQFK